MGELFDVSNMVPLALKPLVCSVVAQYQYKRVGVR